MRIAIIRLSQSDNISAYMARLPGSAGLVAQPAGAWAVLPAGWSLSI